MDGLVKLDKDFLYKDVYFVVKDKLVCEVLSYFEIEMFYNVDVVGGELIFMFDGKLVGCVLFGVYGYMVGKFLVVGFVNLEVVGSGDEVEVMIFGLLYKVWIFE